MGENESDVWKKKHHHLPVKSGQHTSRFKRIGQKNDLINVIPLGCRTPSSNTATDSQSGVGGVTLQVQLAYEKLGKKKHRVEGGAPCYEEPAMRKDRDADEENEESREE
jgi:hypothetical protein